MIWTSIIQNLLGKIKDYSFSSCQLVQQPNNVLTLELAINTSATLADALTLETVTIQYTVPRMIASFCEVIITTFFLFMSSSFKKDSSSKLTYPL